MGHVYFPGMMTTAGSGFSDVRYALGPRHGLLLSIFLVSGAPDGGDLHTHNQSGPISVGCEIEPLVNYQSGVCLWSRVSFTPDCC